jgi:hypothetical protein
MKVEDLIRRYPRLFHMAERGTWESIKQHGLLSTTAILDLIGLETTRRLSYESAHRPDKSALTHHSYGTFILRDQKPMNDERLKWCLQDGLKPEDWYLLLNSKVFFWVSRSRLETLLGARAYRSIEHDVLTVESEPLIWAYEGSIRLAHINTGNTFPYPANRGLSTFKSIAEYPTKRDRVTPFPEVVELVVEKGVPDIAKYVLQVDRMHGATILQTIYKRQP